MRARQIERCRPTPGFDREIVSGGNFGREVLKKRGLAE
jgi:hypothetical protein